MIGTRLLLALTLALGLVAPVPGFGQGGGLFSRKAKSDPARVRQLVEIVRSESNARKRAAAVEELADVDPRIHVEVVPTLIAALRNDASDGVRAGAAEALGRFNVVYPLAGMALEEAAEGDPAKSVRGAARQALWEYHLIGYRSAKGADGIAGQTAEPPFARPTSTGNAVTTEPPAAAVAQAADLVPTPTIAPLPPLGPPPGPRAAADRDEDRYTDLGAPAAPEPHDGTAHRPAARDGDPGADRHDRAADPHAPVRTDPRRGAAALRRFSAADRPRPWPAAPQAHQRAAGGEAGREAVNLRWHRPTEACATKQKKPADMVRGLCLSASGLLPSVS